MILSLISRIYTACSLLILFIYRSNSTPLLRSVLITDLIIQKVFCPDLNCLGTFCFTLTLRMVNSDALLSDRISKLSCRIDNFGFLA